MKKYRIIKTSQGKIFTAPMASGGGLTDLILRCLFNLPPKIGPGVVIHPLTPRPPKGPPFDT